MSDEWTRGSAVIEDDFVDLDWERSEPELYQWVEASSLPYELAAIRHEADVRGLVRRWGLLGHRQSEFDQVVPEPLSDWWDESLRMNFSLYRYALLDKLRRRDRDGARAIAEFHVASYTGALAEADWLHDPAGREELLSAELVDAQDIERYLRRGDLSAMAYDIQIELQEDVDERLQDVRFGLKLTSELEADGVFRGAPVPPGDFILVARCPHLLARAYLQVAMEMTAGVPADVCPEDGRIFAVRDPRQRYCGPQCAGRARQRRFAERRRLSTSS